MYSVPCNIINSEEAKKVKEVILVDCRLEFVFLSSVDFTVIVKVLFDSCILVLLVLRDEVVHVGLGLSELHLVHALPSVPVEESLPPEHGGELLGDSLENFLDGGRVSDKGRGHLETSRRDVADAGHRVVGDPLHEV